MSVIMVNLTPNTPKTINVVEGLIFYIYGSADSNHWLGYKQGYPDGGGIYHHPIEGICCPNLSITSTGETITFTSGSALSIYVLSLYY